MPRRMLISQHRCLQAAVLALRKANREVQRDTYARMRATMNPVWQKIVAEAASMAMFDLNNPNAYDLLSANARINAGNPPVAQTASSTRKIKGSRLVPAIHWPAFEYGTHGRFAYTTYQRRSKSGKVHTVRRRCSIALPQYDKEGHAIGPAFNLVSPRLTAFFVQSTVRAYMDAIESAEGA